MTKNNALRILCIEDNPGEARLIERHLSRSGHSMTWVRKGAEGLAHHKTEPFDVVLIDHLLPDMKGLYVLQELLESDSQLVTVMVTAHGDEETAVSAMKLGAKDYIIKDANSGFTELIPAVIEQAYNQYTILLEKQKAEKATQNREAILSVVAQAAERLLKSPHWQGNIDDIIGRLGRAANVSRVCIVENKNQPGETPVVKSCSEWLKPNANHPPLSIIDQPYEEIGLAAHIDTLKAGQPVFGQIKKQENSAPSLLASDWPRSFALMPIFTDADWWGFIGFDDDNMDRVWQRVEIEALGTAANILGAALQRQLTEATLYQAQKLESIGLLAGGIAHDFNNLLTGILTQNSLSLYKIPPHSAAKNHINMAIQAAEQAADLVRQLLGYAGKGQYQVEPINLNNLIQENTGLFNTISHAKARFHLDLSPNLPAIEADRSQIQQVVMNLVINASESLQEPGGQVHVSTTLVECDQPITVIGRKKLNPGRYVCLSVEDTGGGMNAETIPQIFDPFFSTKSNGRGLGLSATLGIVKAHGGGLQVESAWRQGSTFMVFLPVSQKTAAAPVAPTNLEGQIEATILVIDDEESVLEPVKDGLEMVGAKVLLAENGRQGINIYHEHHQTIDLVVLDMIMPGLDGRKTFLQLQKIDPEISVILSSGYSEVETVRKFSQDEVILFLKKPYRLEKLISAIRTALA